MPLHSSLHGVDDDVCIDRVREVQEVLTNPLANCTLLGELIADVATCLVCRKRLEELGLDCDELCVLRFAAMVYGAMVLPGVSLANIAERCWLECKSAIESNCLPGTAAATDFNQLEELWGRHVDAIEHYRRYLAEMTAALP